MSYSNDALPSADLPAASQAANETSHSGSDRNSAGFVGGHSDSRQIGDELLGESPYSFSQLPPLYDSELALPVGALGQSFFGKMYESAEAHTGEWLGKNDEGPYDSRQKFARFHTQSHGGGMHRCEQCSKTYRYKKDLAHHRNNVHQDDSSGTQPFASNTNSEKIHLPDPDKLYLDDPSSTDKRPFEHEEKHYGAVSPSESTFTARTGLPSEQKLRFMKNVDDERVLFDSQNYFQELDDLEQSVVEACRLREMLPSVDSVETFPKVRSDSLHDARSSAMPDHRLIMDGIMDATMKLQSSGFSHKSISIAIMDPLREQVIKIIDIPFTDIESMSALMNAPGQDKLSLLHVWEVPQKAELMLKKLGIVAEKLKLAVPLLLLVLALGLTSYVGSHCQDLGSLVWGIKNLDTLPLPIGHTIDGRPLHFCRRKLACLHGFIGAGIWVFGTKPDKRLPRNLLSVSVSQLADLWGPIRAIPSPENLNSFDRLVALQTEQGILFQSRKSTAGSLPTVSLFPSRDSLRYPRYPHSMDREVNMHWIPVRRLRPFSTERKLLHKVLRSQTQGNDGLPEDFIPFPSTSRLLIGMQTTSTSTASPSCQSLQTLSEFSSGVGNSIDKARQKWYAHEAKTLERAESCSRQDPSDNVVNGISITTQVPTHSDVRSTDSMDGFRVNDGCVLNLDAWAKDQPSQVHFAGTHDPYYVPAELQIAFNAGQYVNAGIQRVWKRRPGFTLKSSLVRSLSTQNVTANKVYRIMQLHVGLELSACTSNARRITLEDALALANTGYKDEIRSASKRGDANFLSDLVIDLSYTGLTNHAEDIMSFRPGRKKKLLLALPSDQFQDVFEWTCDSNLPRWIDMIGDGRDSACFAVLSPRCLTFSGRRGKKQRRVTSVCVSGSRRQPPDLRPIFQTKIALSSPIADQQLKRLLPLKTGALRIASLPPSDMLVIFIRQPNLAERFVTRKRPRHGEIMDRHRPTSEATFVYVMDEVDHSFSIYRDSKRQ